MAGLHFLPEEQQVQVRSDAPLPMSLTGPRSGDLETRNATPYPASRSLLTAMQTAGRQIAPQANQHSIVVNGRPMTRAALHEYVTASEVVRRTDTEQGTTRDIWNRDIGGVQARPSSFLPTGPAVDPDRAVVSGPTAPGHSARYPSTNIPVAGFNPESVIQHANQMRADFPRSTNVHQGTWMTEGEGETVQIAGLSPKPAGSYVAVDASQEFDNPDVARDEMHARKEDALFHPHSFDPSQDKWGEVKADPNDPMGISDEDAGANFRTRLRRPYTP